MCLFSPCTVTCPLPSASTLAVVFLPLPAETLELAFKVTSPLTILFWPLIVAVPLVLALPSNLLTPLVLSAPNLPSALIVTLPLMCLFSPCTVTWPLPLASILATVGLLVPFVISIFPASVTSPLTLPFCPFIVTSPLVLKLPLASIFPFSLEDKFPPKPMFTLPFACLASSEILVLPEAFVFVVIPSLEPVILFSTFIIVLPTLTWPFEWDSSLGFTSLPSLSTCPPRFKPISPFPWSPLSLVEAPTLPLAVVPYFLASTATLPSTFTLTSVSEVSFFLPFTDILLTLITVSCFLLSWVTFKLAPTVPELSFGLYVPFTFAVYSVFLSVLCLIFKSFPTLIWPELASTLLPCTFMSFLVVILTSLAVISDFAFVTFLVPLVVALTPTEPDVSLVTILYFPPTLTLPSVLLVFSTMLLPLIFKFSASIETLLPLTLEPLMFTSLLEEISTSFALIVLSFIEV